MNIYMFYPSQNLYIVINATQKAPADKLYSTDPIDRATESHSKHPRETRPTFHPTP